VVSKKIQALGDRSLEINQIVELIDERREATRPAELADTLAPLLASLAANIRPPSTPVQTAPPSPGTSAASPANTNDQALVMTLMQAAARGDSPEWHAELAARSAPELAAALAAIGLDVDLEAMTIEGLKPLSVLFFSWFLAVLLFLVYFIYV